jgi:hypothetical protein
MTEKLEKVPQSPESLLGDKIKKVLSTLYDQYLKDKPENPPQDKEGSFNGHERFNAFHNPEDLKAILEQAGIDTANLIIAVDTEKKITSPTAEQAGKGFFWTGTQVTIGTKEGDKTIVLINKFFEDIDPSEF